MALFLYHRVILADRNGNGIHSCIVEAADDASARPAAVAAAPDGESKVRPTWGAVSPGSGTIPAPLPSVLWLEGDAVTVLGRRRRNCWDNAVAESFFGSPKRERVPKQGYRSHREARAEVFDYIEMFYNPRRRHSHLGQVSPEAFEKASRLALEVSS